MRYTAWSEEEYRRLKELVTSGASITLKRSKQSSQGKARVLSTPFPSELVERTKRREIFVSALATPDAHYQCRSQLGAKDLLARFIFYYDEIPFADKSGLFGPDPMGDKTGVIPRLFIICAVMA
jgi:hypothetical protein